ncbi:MAG: DEAD/DEAH box helicase [bacterium]|nr:DEAD/DEAH box helicase [bacterium]
MSNSLSILLELSTFGRLKFSVLNKGKNLSLYSRELPHSLRHLIKAANNYDSIEEELRLFLNDRKIEIPFNVITADGPINFEWDPDFKLTAKTEFQVYEGQVRVYRVCFYNNKVLRYFYPVGKSFIADPVSRKLGVLDVKQNNGWEIWNKINELNSNKIKPVPKKKKHISTHYYSVIEAVNQPLEISFAGFSSYLSQLNFDCDFTFLPELSFSRDVVVGNISEKLDIDFGISVLKDIDPIKMILRFEYNLNNRALASDKRLFDYFSFLQLEKAGVFIRNRKELKQTLSKLIGEKNKEKAKEIINEYVNNSALVSYEDKKKSLNFLESFFDYIQFKNKRLILFQGKWFLIDIDSRKESLMYSISFDLFEKIRPVTKEVEEVSVDSMFEIEILSDDLFDKLSVYKKLLEDYGIKLKLQEKQIELVSWDFSIDARSNVNWFELHPKVRFNGELIEDSVWQNILNKKGVREYNELVHVLDERSLDILHTLMDLMPVDKKERKTLRKEIILSRLQIFDWIHLKKQGVYINLADKDQEMLDKLLDFKKIESRDFPSGFKGVLRDYQLQGYYWLSFLYEYKFGACLADDMGLGKTIQTIVFLAAIKEGLLDRDISKTPHLIVVPPTILFNWRVEIDRFYPDFKVSEYCGFNRNPDFDGYDIVLTTYEIVRRDIMLLKKKRFCVIVFDEVQSVKNIFAERSSAVRQLQCDFKTGLTGTPLENHLGEYYSIMDLLVPGLLGSYKDFSHGLNLSQTRMSSASENMTGDLQRVIKRFVSRTRPFVMRRKKDTIITELPPKFESDVFLKLSDKQKAFYTAIVDQVKKTVDQAYSNKSASAARIIALTAILRLRQTCLSPSLIDPDFNEIAPKITFIKDKLLELREEGHSVLVFSQFRTFLKLVAGYLEKEGLNFFYIDGNVPVSRRKDIVDNFQNSVAPATFLMSLKTGGFGLNLTKASYVFHLDPWWNPAIENQASDRAHRIGQPLKVFVTRLLMHHTVEEKMMMLKSKKRELFETVIEKGSALKSGEMLTREDFDFLLG